jgi:hypothetical protein
MRAVGFIPTVPRGDSNGPSEHPLIKRPLPRPVFLCPDRGWHAQVLTGRGRTPWTPGRRGPRPAEDLGRATREESENLAARDPSRARTCSTRTQRATHDNSETYVTGDATRDKSRGCATPSAPTQCASSTPHTGELCRQKRGFATKVGRHKSPRHKCVPIAAATHDLVVGRPLMSSKT